MRRTLPLFLIAASLVFAGEARADDDLEECARQATAWLAKNPPIKPGPDVSVVSSTRLLYRCRSGGGLGEAFVAAVRGKRGWVTTKLGVLHCAKLQVSRAGVLIEHTDSCPARYYQQNACVDMRSRVTFGKRRPALKKLSTKRRAACRYCPDSTDLRCAKRARAAARRLFETGQIKVAAKLLRGVLEHLSDYAINMDAAWVDPMTINDALFYSARARIQCRSIAETWRQHANRTTRSRKAFVANLRRCKRIEPRR